MRYVIFVGDKCSKTNISNDIAYVGARCFSTLVKWIKVIDPDYYICINADSRKNFDTIEKLYNEGFTVVTLGSKADAKVKKYTKISDAYRMEHPSGLNRKLNNAKYVSKMLQDLKEFIDSK